VRARERRPAVNCRFALGRAVAVTEAVGVGAIVGAVRVTVQTERQRLAIVGPDIEIGAPAGRRARQRTAARQPVGDRTSIEENREMRVPIVPKESLHLAEKAALDGVAVEIAILPDAKPGVLFTELPDGF